MPAADEWIGNAHGFECNDILLGEWLAVEGEPQRADAVPYPNRGHKRLHAFHRRFEPLEKTFRQRYEVIAGQSRVQLVAAALPDRQNVNRLTGGIELDGIESFESIVQQLLRI